MINEFGPLGRGKVTSAALLDLLHDKAGTTVTVKAYRPSAARQVEVSVALPPVVSYWDFAGREK